MLHQWEVGWECPECHMKRGPDKIDPCLGHLSGVKYACCGHGGVGQHTQSRSDGGTGGYIYFESGKVIRFDKITEIEDCTHTAADQP